MSAGRTHPWASSIPRSPHGVGSPTALRSPPVPTPRGEDGLVAYVMCEIPNNAIQIDAFARLFDGFSIGSNDLTQLKDVDRDSETVVFDVVEREPGMLEKLKRAVTGAKR
jgi:phosphoenolpyruvate synthase/pyruvate phosphate dikinase